VNGAKKKTPRPTNNSINIPLPLIENHHDQSVKEDEMMCHLQRINRRPEIKMLITLTKK